MSGLTTWPIRVAPLPGEALDSWLETCALRMNSLLGEVLIAAGLLDDPQISRRQELPPNYTIYLTDAEASRLSRASGVAAAQLHAMTLRAYEWQAVRFDPDKRAVARAALWGKGEGSRYCPQCLDELGGRWLLRWRLSWAFACTRHRTLLADRCPDCGQETRLHRSRRAAFSPFPPSRCCGTRIAGSNCVYDLTTAPAIRLDDGHPFLAAQSFVDTVLDRAGTVRADDGSPEPRVVLDELRTLASWILQRTRPGDFTSYGTHVDAAHRAYQHTGVFTRHFPPIDPAITAAALTRAIEILTGDDHAALAALQTLLDREPAWSRALLPRGLDRHPDRISPHLYGLLLRILDRDMHIAQRLQHRSCTTTPRRPTGELAARRVQHVPQLLWPGWTVRLKPRRVLTCTDTFRVAVAAALLLPDMAVTTTATGRRHCGGFPAAVAILHPGTTDHRNVAEHLRQVVRAGHDRLLPAICALAEYLDQHGSPINYARRRSVIRDDLLPEHVWQQICDRVGAPRNTTKRLATVRRWLYQRLTGNDPAHAPTPFAFTTTGEWTRYLNLPRHLPKPIHHALDQYAQQYLASKGIHEPITWEPPATCAAGLTLPGTQPSNIDIDAVHELIGERKLRLPDAAIALNTTPDHIRLALEQHPLSADQLWRAR